MKSKIIITSFASLILSLNAFGQYYKFVDPLIGSSGDGNVFVGPSCPFGMVKPGPDTHKMIVGAGKLELWLTNQRSGNR